VQAREYLSLKVYNSAVYLEPSSRQVRMNSPFTPTPDYVHISHLNTVLGVQGQRIPENESTNTQQLEGCPYLARTERTSAEAISHILRASYYIRGLLPSVHSY
jgi:hypothetical protein